MAIYPQTAPYKLWNWQDNHAAEGSPDPKWVQVSDVGTAAFPKARRKGEGGLKKRDHFVAFKHRALFTQELREGFRLRGA
ncbi:MAG: hypothetical protein WB762_29460 [Candidatus Sulfotelmatobacter sp.]